MNFSIDDNTRKALLATWFRNAGHQNVTLDYFFPKIALHTRPGDIGSTSILTPTAA
jgi:hypothetical protein